MRLKNLSVNCPCCGRQIKIAVRQSVFVPDFGMDGKPFSIGALPRIYHCDFCNYCYTDADNKVSENELIIARSEEYNEIWKDAGTSDEDKKYLSALKFAMDEKREAELWMAFCWLLEFEGKSDEADKARLNAVRFQADIINKYKNFDIMLQRMDSLRQLGHFDDALSIIAEIKPLVSPASNPYLVRLLIYEKKLIVAKDSKAHFQSEAI